LPTSILNLIFKNIHLTITKKKNVSEKISRTNTALTFKRWNSHQKPPLP